MYILGYISVCGYNVLMYNYTNKVFMTPGQFHGLKSSMQIFTIQYCTTHWY